MVHILIVNFFECVAFLCRTQNDDINLEADVTYQIWSAFPAAESRFFYYISLVKNCMKQTVCLSNKLYVYQTHAVENLHASCEMAKCFYYETKLLTYFTKGNNVDFIYFQNYA